MEEPLMGERLNMPVLAETLVADNGSLIGVLTLSAEKTLNALSLPMVDLLAAQLAAWAYDEHIAMVLLQGAGEKAFCAGGDLHNLYSTMMGHRASRQAGDVLGNGYANEFFAREYTLDYRIHTYPKPILCWGHGIVMGGGIGLMAGASHRVATEKTRLAMPETGIGLFPDVGGGWYLPRLPGRVGQFMALTGARLDGAECRYLQLAPHYVEQAGIEELVERVTIAPARAKGALGTAGGGAVPDAKIEQNLSQITRLFASDRLEDILHALEVDEGEWAHSELATLKSKSPLSCKVSLRLLAEGAARTSFADEMRAEYALAGRVVRTHDFREGVRAVLIDKTGDPQWDPATPEEVTEEMLDVLFEPLHGSEAWTPFPEVAQ
jgi:enoyl-CoA hydratase/carnithine racemase